MKEQIQEILEEARRSIPSCESDKDLEELRIKYLGKKSSLSDLLSKIGTVLKEKRPQMGALLNKVKKEIAQLIEQKKLVLHEQADATKAQGLDVTMPGRPLPIGAKHPLYQIWEEIEDIFINLGFEVAEGPEIESEYYNFDALNTPSWHPARNPQDTFYLKGGMLLRTQTSPMQIRVMEKFKPPIKIISTGRCYRVDKVDPSHLPVFHQVEALMVGEGITMSDLKGALDSFVKRIFSADTRSRFRPHFFPFTEPSAEIDLLCISCKGKGCKLCKNSGWLEMGGAGMVDPAVLEEVGYDPEKYTGYAFGLGIERIAMLRYGISDIRKLVTNDLRILSQFQ
ncbi:MAG: phenylalanine--tRNA ligase subunit alpha [Candidatus Celaenobacter antarcticus]|nr:phenylalanine--tRNA ligase subunit alpha [Candidatus Celaenobacter antarcticus]MDP8314421.1 phenylalanine--tRNA ligase subunit alpha [Candidatus Celaenobacter antarcticus]